MTMMTDPIRILFGSDYHFGIPTINQEDMAIAFAETIFPLLSQTDIFFINGDFFDRLLIFDSHGFAPIYDTIINLFTLCEKHQITLRILQGTWMHDLKQCRQFETFYRNKECTFNFRFAEGIELEEITIRDRSLKVLFVPDDLPFKSSDDTLTVIHTKMTDKGWDSVDYACMHGFFDFTFPKNVSQENVVVYKEAQFPFVKKMIDVGHVHQHRIVGRVISNGSFDRMCFGDEDPKGCIKVLDYLDHYTAQFIENKQTAVFDTITFTKDDTTETIRERITNHLNSLTTRRKISLRFRIEMTEHKAAITSWMKDVYPDVYFRFKTDKDKDDQGMVVPSSALLVAVEKRTPPTPKTIATFIRAHIPDTYDLSTERIDEYLLPIVP